MWGDGQAIAGSVVVWKNFSRMFLSELKTVIGTTTHIRNRRDLFSRYRAGGSEDAFGECTTFR